MHELKYQFLLIQAIRNFFNQEGFLDVLTPPMVENPGMETHIHPFEVIKKRTGRTTQHYLHTSPEFHMKKLLTLGEDFKKIYTINYCFRDEPQSPIHRPQFLMCEWYRAHQRYEKIMQDCQNLLKSTHHQLKEKGLPLIDSNPITLQKVTVKEIFEERLNFNILDFLKTKDLKEKIVRDFRSVPIPEQECEWDDYFFLLFLNEIEPEFKNIKGLLLYEFPAPLSALSTLKESNPLVCERFEIYIRGIELCNCFNELTDYREQKRRFDQQMLLKKEIYNYTLPEPKNFYNTLKNGYPQSSGIALGVERLLLSLIETNHSFFN